MSLPNIYTKISGLSQSQIAFSESPKKYAENGKAIAIAQGMQLTTDRELVDGGGGNSDFGFGFYGYSSSSSQSVQEQFNIDNILGQYFFPPLINSIDGFMDEIESKLDLGGDLKKARITYSSIPKGIFDFSKASRGLIRPVEYYCSELDALISPNDVTPKYINLVKTFFTKVKDKKYFCEPRQEGTTEMLKAFPSKLRKVLLPKLNIFVPETIMGEQIVEMGGKKLRFTSTEKKVYAFRKTLGGGTAPFVDIYINNIGYWGTDSEGRFLKALPSLMMSKILQSAGVRTRIWAGEFSIYNQNLYIAPILVKEYGDPLDLNTVGVIVSDSRFFRGVGRTSKGGVLYGNSKFWNDKDKRVKLLNTSFNWGSNNCLLEDASSETMKYVKNAFKEYEKLGLVKPTQAPKDLMMYLPSPFKGDEKFMTYEDEDGNSVDLKNAEARVVNGERVLYYNDKILIAKPIQDNVDLVVEYFYRGMDYVQLLLSKNPKAIISQARRRVIDKEIEKGSSESDSIYRADEYLSKILINDVFKNVTYTNNDEDNPNMMQKIYQSTKDEIISGKEKRKKLLDMINDQIVTESFKSQKTP